MNSPVTLEVFSTIESIASQVDAWRRAGLRIGLVPTMGNLHAGHLDLFKTLSPHCDRVVASIFANPLQFGANEDYASYPRTLEEDIRQLNTVGTHALFAPNVQEMYGDEGMSDTKVSVKRLNNRYCGAVREGHFIGVATVVCKLFNIVTPHVAVFGEKDFQQLAVIRQMVHDLSIRVKILGSPTYREDSGLAFSSRNQYLSVEERTIAPQIYVELCKIREQIDRGNRNYSSLTTAASEHLKSAGFAPDYVAVADANTLDKPTRESDTVVVLVAARLGRARLIDNVQVPLK